MGTEHFNVLFRNQQEDEKEKVEKEKKKRLSICKIDSKVKNEGGTGKEIAYVGLGLIYKKNGTVGPPREAQTTRTKKTNLMSP